MKSKSDIVSSCVFFLVLSVLMPSAYSATLAKINQHDVGSARLGDIIHKLHLAPRYQLKPTTLTILPNGLKKQKYQIFYQGVTVWNSSLTMTLDKKGNVHSVYGFYVKGLAAELKTTKPKITGDEALMHAIASLGITSNHKLELKQAKLYIRLNKIHQPRLIYHVSFLRQGDKPTRPHFFIDAITGALLSQWEGLNYQKVATGPGGNQKIGLYEYGSDFDFMDVDVRGSACWMINDKVDTMNHIVDNTFGFNCPRNTYGARNGAYSAINDAHFFATVVADMYQQWYKQNPLDKRIRQLVYAFDGANASWNGLYVSFGNGNGAYFPFTTLDITSHEIAHGFTQRYSGLLYRQQSGGMNESFSDIAGEAAKYYLFNKTDWIVGADAAKTSWGLRSFINPTRDGKQITHTRDYRPNMEVHTSSGPFNHAFYLLSQMKGWDIHKAFDVFVLANKQYWLPESTFEQGAEGLAQAAIDLNYSAADVCIAFRQIGAECHHYPAPGHEPIEIFNGEQYAGINSEVDLERVFKITIPENVSNLRITIRGGEGDADLLVARAFIPTLDHYDCRPNLSGNDETCFFNVPQPGIYYILLHASLAYSNVTLAANYIENGCPKTIDLRHLSGKEGSQQYFRYCPDVAGNKILINGGEGDADLYVKKGAKPTLTDYDCRPFKRGNNESCTLGEPGQYMIMLHGYKDYSDLRLHSHGNDLR